MFKYFTGALIALTLLATFHATAWAQSRIGCSIEEAERLEDLASSSERYKIALGPNLALGNFPGTMRDDVTAFVERRASLYRYLDEFVETAEDLAWAIRVCDRESSR